MNPTPSKAKPRRPTVLPPSGTVATLPENEVWLGPGPFFKVERETAGVNWKDSVSIAEPTVASATRSGFVPP